jgi:hypothetical protein
MVSYSAVDVVLVVLRLPFGLGLDLPPRGRGTWLTHTLAVADAAQGNAGLPGWCRSTVCTGAATFALHVGVPARALPVCVPGSLPAHALPSRERCGGPSLLPLMSDEDECGRQNVGRWILSFQRTFAQCRYIRDSFLHAPQWDL